MFHISGGYFGIFNQLMINIYKYKYQALCILNSVQSSCGIKKNYGKNCPVESFLGGHIELIKQQNDFPPKNNSYIYLNIFHCSVNPTWLPWKPLYIEKLNGMNSKEGRRVLHVIWGYSGRSQSKGVPFSCSMLKVHKH